jgi:hypothetical protein
MNGEKEDGQQEVWRDFPPSRFSMTARQECNRGSGVEWGGGGQWQRGARNEAESSRASADVYSLAILLERIITHIRHCFKKGWG